VATLTCATWNAAWAKPGTRRGLEVAEILASLNADVIVLTEGFEALLPAGGHVIDGGDDWGYVDLVVGRRKVLVWSRSPWESVSNCETGAMAGRFVSGITMTPAGRLHVFGVCIPWRDAHVRTGRRDRAPWQEHVEGCRQLGDHIGDRDQSIPLIVAGDLNQRIPRQRQPQEVADELALVLDGFVIHTDGETEQGALIDHIVTTDELLCGQLFTRSGKSEIRQLSDHAGVAVELILRPASEGEPTFGPQTT
jgi:hypothetical protein